jgi:WD40 repeat protein
MAGLKNNRMRWIGAIVVVGVLVPGFCIPAAQQEKSEMLVRRKQAIIQGVNDQLPGQILNLISEYDMAQWTMPAEGKISIPQENITCFTTTSDGQYLAVGTEKGAVYLFRTDTWERVADFQIGDLNAPVVKTVVRAIVFSPNNRYLAYSIGAGVVHIRSMETGKVVNALNFDPSGNARKGVLAIAFSPDSRRFVLGYAGNMYYYEIEKGAETFFEKAHFDNAHSSHIKTLIFLNNMSIASAAIDDSHVKIWDILEEGITERYSFDLEAPVTTLAYSSMQEILAVGSSKVSKEVDENIYLLKIGNELRSKKLKEVIAEKDSTPVKQLLFSVNQRYLIGLQDLDVRLPVRKAYIIDLMHVKRAMKLHMLMFPAEGSVQKIIFSPDNQYVVGLINGELFFIENFLEKLERAERRIHVFNSLNREYNNHYKSDDEPLQKYNNGGNEVLVDKAIGQLIIKDSTQAIELLEAIAHALKADDWVAVDEVRLKLHFAVPVKQSSPEQRLQNIMNSPDISPEHKKFLLEMGQLVHNYGEAVDVSSENVEQKYETFLNMLTLFPLGDFLDEPSLQKFSDVDALSRSGRWLTWDDKQNSCISLVDKPYINSINERYRQYFYYLNVVCQRLPGAHRNDQIEFWLWRAIEQKNERALAAWLKFLKEAAPSREAGRLPSANKVSPEVLACVKQGGGQQCLNEVGPIVAGGALALGLAHAAAAGTSAERYLKDIPMNVQVSAAVVVGAALAQGSYSLATKREQWLWSRFKKSKKGGDYRSRLINDLNLFFERYEQLAVVNGIIKKMFPADSKEVEKNRLWFASFRWVIENLGNEAGRTAFQKIVDYLRDKERAPVSEVLQSAGVKESWGTGYVKELFTFDVFKQDHYQAKIVKEMLKNSEWLVEMVPGGPREAAVVAPISLDEPD